MRRPTVAALAEQVQHLQAQLEVQRMPPQMPESMRFGGRPADARGLGGRSAGAGSLLDEVAPDDEASALVQGVRAQAALAPSRPEAIGSGGLQGVGLGRRPPESSRALPPTRSQPLVTFDLTESDRLLPGAGRGGGGVAFADQRGQPASRAPALRASRWQADDGGDYGDEDPAFAATGGANIFGHLYERGGGGQPAPQRPPPRGGAREHSDGRSLDRMEAAIAAMAQSQAAFFQAMAAQQQQGPRDTMSALAGPGMSGAVGGAPGARGIAVLEQQRVQCEAQPLAVTQLIRANAGRAMEVPTAGPAHATMVDFVTRFMPWGRAAKGSIMLSFGIAHAADRCALGQWEQAETLLHLLLCCMEQSLYDENRWTMAWLSTHLPEPPWHMMQMSAPTDSIRPYGRLTPPEWVAASMQFVKDAAALAEVRRRGGGGHVAAAEVDAGEEPAWQRSRGARAKNKAKAKARPTGGETA